MSQSRFHDPRRDLRPRARVGHPDAPPAGRLAAGACRAAERRPAVLGPPRERLAGVPGGAVGAHGGGAQIPAVLSWAVVVVGRPDVARLLRRGSRGTGAQERNIEIERIDIVD